MDLTHTHTTKESNRTIRENFSHKVNKRHDAVVVVVVDPSLLATSCHFSVFGTWNAVLKTFHSRRDHPPSNGPILDLGSV